MHVLWLINTLPPEAARGMGLNAGYGGSWLTAQLGRLHGKEGLSLCVVSPAGLKEQRCWRQGNITYVALAKGEDTPSALASLLEKQPPDLVHIFGTEYPHTLAMLKAVGKNVPALVSIQGLVSRCEKVFFAGMPAKYHQASGLKKLLCRLAPVHGGVLELDHAEMAIAARNERQALALAQDVGGRTSWDKKGVLAVNPSLRYHHQGEVLRPAFYRTHWRRENAVPRRIFLSQGGYPIKGLHLLLEQLPAVVARYPDTRLVVGGQSIYDYKGPVGWAVDYLYEYQNHIKTRIAALKLEKHVTFTGPLTEAEMCEEYLKAGLFVLPSTIENSPNSLGEAMILGLPCVCNDVGGVGDMAEDGKEALLCPPDATDALAQGILRLFGDEELGRSMGRAARARALQTHNPEAITEELLALYVALAADSSTEEQCS